MAYEYCNGTIIKPQLVGLTEGLTACKRACEACMAAGLDRSPLHREEDDSKLNFVSLNFRIFMLIFIGFVAVVAILKERSGVPLPASLDYALAESTAD